MKFNSKVILITCGVIFVVLQAGCSKFPKGQEISSSTDYNMVVEKAQNSMILMNIVRASKRSPMYFTNFKQLRGSMNYSIGTGSLTVPFGKVGLGAPGPATFYSIAPSISYSNNPQFDLNVSDDKEFIDGLTSSPTLTIVNYYLLQGWPDMMLWNLFIQQINASDGEFRNYPENKEEFANFQKKLVEMLREDNCHIEIEEKSDFIGPEISAKDLTSIEQLVNIGKAELKLTPTKKDEKGNDVSYRLETQAMKDYVFVCKCKKKYKIADVSSFKQDKTESILLRSPEAIMYYLGEIKRAEEQGFIPKIDIYSDRCKNKPPVPLFLISKPKDKDSEVWKIAEMDNPYVDVDYDGIRYVIPRWKNADPKDECLADRSMHVMSFISLLLAKQRTKEIAPATGVVSIIGR